MIPYFGDFAEDATVYIAFNTFSSDDPSASVTITNLADADLKVHKDGSLTQIATDGATVVRNFDSITGNHMVTIDTSVHADYSTGSDYHIRIEGTTVDGATVNAFIGHFSIENRFSAAADDLANATDGLGALKALIVTLDTVADGIDTEVSAIKAVTDALPDSGALTTIAADAARLTAARAAVLTDWINGGRLDLLLDAIPTTAMRGTDSAALASVCTEVRLATLTDWINGGRLDLLLDAIPTTAMRGTDSAALASVCTEARLAELASANIPSDVDTLLTRLTASRAALLDQITAVRMATLTDWINGGRLDLLLDAIPTTAMRGTDSANTTTPLTAAQVNAQVVDVLRTDTPAELSAIPAAAPDLHAMIQFIYMALRNKIDVTANAKEVHNNAGTVIGTKTLSDDGTTYSEAKMS